MSSTYCFHNLGLEGADSRASSSKNSMYRLATMYRLADGETEEERPPTVHLPYVAGVSERIGRVCRDFNIRAVFKSGPTILTKVKDLSPGRSKRTSSTKCLAPAERCTSSRIHAGLEHA